MNFNSLDEVAIAAADVNQHVEQLADAVAPELKPLVPAKIRVERVSFTRNASNTPYVVYWVGDRRCSTFIKRSRFLELVQMLLKLKYSIEDRITAIISSAHFGLSIKLGAQQQYIPRVFVNKFFERYNTVSLERVQPVSLCECNDLYDMCLHSIATVVFSQNLDNSCPVKRVGRVGEKRSRGSEPLLDR